MPNEIRSKFQASLATQTLTISLASFGSSTSYAGRQSTFVDNSATLWQLIHVWCKITTGTSPVAGKSIYAFLLKANKGSSFDVATDGAGATDANLTFVTALQVAAAVVDATSSKAYIFDFVIRNPGPAWAIGISHDTNTNLHATAGNHSIWWVGQNPDIQ